jgi:two-component system chemotaxis response regulator CheB
MSRKKSGAYRAVVLGVSTGGVKALKLILPQLAADFPVPILIVSHISPEADDGLAVLLDDLSAIRVKEADEGEPAVAGTVYLAPANYHLLVERDGTLALSTDPPVSFARPSVDVLFESAALVYGDTLIGIVLTGAGSDGSNGLKAIKKMRGLAIVQNPADAEMDAMPVNALQAVKADHLVTLDQLPALVTKLVQGSGEVRGTL